MFEPEDEFKTKAIEFSRDVFDFIKSGSVGHGWERLFALGLLVAVLLGVGFAFLKASGVVLEGLIKLIETYRNSSLPVVFAAEKKKKIRKRQQFCSVLDADLAYIAKAENWNDQYFTDLEAEVETEGGYYTSALNRLRKRKFSGLRRVSSLMRAIETSSERSVLLVGEPGSGKSVALRHLAKQLAEKGKKSKNLAALVPLYLNLRELEVGEQSEINADLIQQFVIENIRRGDADTSAYVQDNWLENKEKGTWFFLFDSFDEIPGVLHAATGSAAVRQYSEAIRQFLDGMGGCRGILASREYKGPDALPWKKFRILPLSKQRQTQLVENSFLDPDEIHLVQQHLAMERSALGNNPLFLTLLCRYVKDENAQPANDHQLLTSHLSRLAAREPDYIFRKYQLTSEQLIEGAERLAVLFAQNPLLSLAPRVDEIFSALDVTEDSREGLQVLISALVDVKIGRNDVSTARQGDRRFAFSHRRYQETLFANYLAANEGFIDTRELLTAPQWREYAVTLLQTQDAKNLTVMLQVANELINEADAGMRTLVGQLVNEQIGFYEWDSQQFVPVLEILQEGLVRRLEDVPAELSESICTLLSPRWDHGDHLDRYMVIKLGGLLPQSVLISYLNLALSDQYSELSEIAFKQCVFLRETSVKTEHLICRRLAAETLQAADNVSKLRLEALAAQLPVSVGALHVFRRCARLRFVLAILSALTSLAMSPAMLLLQVGRIFPPLRNTIVKLSRSFSFRYRGGGEWGLGIVLPAMIFLIAALERSDFIRSRVDLPPDPTAKLLWTLMDTRYFAPFSALYIFGCLALIAIYRVRDEGNKIKISSIFAPKRLFLLGREILIYGIAILAVIIIGFLPWGLGIVGNWVIVFFKSDFHVNSVYLEVGMPIAIGIAAIGGLALIVSEVRETARQMRKLAELRAEAQDDLKVLFRAASFDEAARWLRRDYTFLSDPKNVVRSASTIILRLWDCVPVTTNGDFPLLSNQGKANAIALVSRALEGRILEVK